MSLPPGPTRARSLRFRGALLLLLLTLSWAAHAQAPDNFVPPPNSPVLALALHPDGSWLAGGNFVSPRNGLARFELNNSLDNSFNPGVNGGAMAGVATINLQIDGSMFVGGSFTNLGSLPRARLGRLRPEGLAGLDFNLGANSNLFALAIQPDGKVLIAGNFTTLAGQARAYLGRLNSEGTLDDLFAPTINGPVRTLWVQNDGKILLGGDFTEVNGLPRNFLARLNSDGNLDGTFDPGADGPVNCFALQADDRILVAGDFGNLAGQTRLHLARLESNGLPDLTFAPEAGGEIHSLVVQADGRIFVGGNFTNFNSLARSNLVRIQADGTLDDYFPEPNAEVLSLGLQTDGRLIVSGNFTTIGGSSRTRLARLTNDIPAMQSLTAGGGSMTWLRSGSCPEVFQAEFAFSTNGLDWMTLPAPSRVVGGWQLTGAAIPAHATLRARGEVHGGHHNNSGWWLEYSTGPVAISSTPADQVVLFGIPPRFAVTAAGDGPFFYRWYRSNVLVYASQYPNYSFPVAVTPGVTQYEVAVSNDVGNVRSRIASLWLPGADALNGGLSSSINAALPLPDGSIVVGGAISGLARFNPNGAFDPTFYPSVNGTVTCLASQADGRILAAGSFTTVGGITRNRLARLNAFGGVDPDFNPNVSGSVNAMLVLADGSILIGGAFLMVGNVSHPYLARLNPDGTPDATFNPYAGGIVHALAMQPDGMILVGGAFSQMNGSNRQRLARLLPDGSLDTTFNPGAVGTAIYSLLVQPDGNILVAGNFVSLGGQSRSRIGRLLASGVIDTNFNPNANGDIFSLQLQTDGKIWVGGAFSSLGGFPRNSLARLNPDGSLDPTIGQNSSASGTLGLTLQADGKLIVAGGFTSLYSSSRSRLGRVVNNYPSSQVLTNDGINILWQRGGSGVEIDHAVFDYCTNGTDWVGLPIAARIAGGWQVAGVSVPPGATLRARGYLNGGFNNGSSQVIEMSSGPPVISVSPTNLPLSYGTSERLSVTTYGDGPFAFQWYRNGVALPTETNSWLNILGLVSVNEYQVVVTTPNGTVQSDLLPFWATGADGLNPNADGTVYAIAVQPDQQILLGGTFTNSPGDRLARLHPSGTRDTSFAPVVTGGSVYALAVQADGKILVGGNFTGLNGQVRNALGRLHSDGSLDPTFSPGASAFFGAGIQCLTIQPDDRILVGGYFDFLAGQSRYCLGRLHPDGTLDSSFVPPTGGVGGTALEAGVASMIVASNGDLIVAGELKETDPSWTTYVERLDSNGARLGRIFANFAFGGPPPPAAHVLSAVRQPDGGIILGGRFDWMENGQFRQNLARLDPDGLLDVNFTNSANNYVTALAVQADGKVLVGGVFTTLAGQSRNGLGRLNPDGTLDTSFSLQPSGVAWVHALAVQPDGKPLVGGNFTNLAGFRRNNIGRLLGPEIATESLTWDGFELNWQRSAASPEVGPTILEASSDGVDWSYLGEGSRTAEGWTWSNITPPPDSLLRVRGLIGGGESFWSAQSLLPTAPPAPPLILNSSGTPGFASNQFELQVTGSFGHLAVLEASTNLSEWVPIQTNRLYLQPADFNDAYATNFPNRFYRARLQ